MASVARLAVRRPTAIVLYLIITARSGIQSPLGIKLELTPEVETPILVTTTVYVGVSPEGVNDLIAMKQGDVISALDRADTAQSYSRENVAIVLIQHEYSTNMNMAYVDLKRATDGIHSDMPDDTEEPDIMELDMSSQPVVTFAVSEVVDGNPYTCVDEKLVPKFEKPNSMDEVFISGRQKKYAHIELAPEKPEQYHLSISTVAQLVGATGFTIPAGDINVGKQRLGVSVGNDYENTGSLKSMAIPPLGGNIIHLSDMAEVYDALGGEDSIGRCDGQDIISLGIRKQQSSVTIEASKQVLSETDKLQEVNPGTSITVVNDSSEIIMESISNVTQTTITVIILSTIILQLPYGDIRTPIIVRTSIPISAVLTPICMSTMKFPLSVTSLTSLVLGVGMATDNPINVLDECFRAKERLNFYDAVIEGSRTVISFITSGMVTTYVVSLPLALLSGMPGQLFKQLGYTVVFRLTASLFSAVTIVPLCYLQQYPRENGETLADRGIKFMQAWYRSYTPPITPRIKIVFAVNIELLIAALFMASQPDLDLTTSVGEDIVQVIIETKPGLPVVAVNEAMANLEEPAGDDEDVDHYLLTYGSSGLSINGGSDVTLDVYLKDEGKLSADQAIEKRWHETQYYKGCSVSIKQSSTVSFGALSPGDEVEVDLQSTDYDALKAASDQLVEGLRERKDVTQVHLSTKNVASVMKMEVDSVKAQVEGPIPASIRSVIHSSLSGVKASAVCVSGEGADVKVEFAPDRYGNIGKSQGIIITIVPGTTLPLEDLADIYYWDNPQQIERKDKQYQVAIATQSQVEYKRTIEENVKVPANEWKLPENVSPAINSMDEVMGEGLGALGGVLVTSMLLISIVTDIQFESLKHSLMVMVTIPFSPIGSSGLLYLTDNPISMTPMLGSLILVGIVANNGILYVGTVNRMPASVSLMEALVEVGAICMRPILMTTPITAISMIPNALAYGGVGKTIRGPALINTDGLMASTVLILILPSTSYKVMYQLGRKWAGSEGEPSYG